jgi:anti-sigma-K factor RskA
MRFAGPRTEEGKNRSRMNAVRHGLTAETVIGALEDAEDYKAFEAAVVADYDARTAVERELVLRLASLLWRLRRSIGIETDLLQSQQRQSKRNGAKSVRTPGKLKFALASCRLPATGQLIRPMRFVATFAN